LITRILEIGPITAIHIKPDLVLIYAKPDEHTL
jgi:hypothetical protein